MTTVRWQWLFLLAVSLLSWCVVLAQNRNIRSAKEKSLVTSETLFLELFNGVDNRPDTAIWKLCSFSKNAWAQHFKYVNGYENVRVENGLLKLTASKRDGHYCNGGIRTIKGFPTDTRLEVKARLTRKVRGGFPAIWQMPIGGKAWPKSGEIDVMEWVQATPNEIYQTVHTAYNKVVTGTTSATNTQPNRTVDVTKFHVYAVDRTDSALVFYIDGKETWRYENKHLVDSMGNLQFPFSNFDFDIILNFSLGGTLNGATTWPGEINDADLPAEMWVDWVRVTKLKGERTDE